MVRFLEVFFRHKLLILLPPILIPLIVGAVAILTTPVEYEAVAGVWVDRPTYLDFKSDWDPWMSPADNQSARLDELLQTRAFQIAVARRVPALAALVGTARGEDRLGEFIQKGVFSSTTGNNLLVLRFRASTAELSFQTLNAVADTFREQSASDRTTQAGLAISFYQSRVQQATDELAKRNRALTNYLATPRQSDPVVGAGAAGAANPRRSNLQRGVDSQQAEVDRLNTLLEQAQLDASAALEGQDLGFQIIDPPRMPTAPTRNLGKRLIFPIAGLLVGLGLSTILLVLLIASDRSIQSEVDIPGRVRVLGTVPSLKLKLKGIPKPQRRDAMRRAIGFAAGTALPAPGGGK